VACLLLGSNIDGYRFVRPVNKFFPDWVDLMLRGMVFVDHMNFNIAVQDYYIRKLNIRTPRLDYNTVFKSIVELKGVDYLKTIIFSPKPDDFLMEDEALRNYYKWIQGIKNARYIDIVEGRYIARPTNPEKEMSLAERTSYYKVEKGTDINLALHAIIKAQNNSYDVAFVVSADTDYISLFQQLKLMGKLVVAVAVKDQSLARIIPEVDDYIILTKEFFDGHVR